MPLRMLREGILTSERVDKLSPPAEVFYRRLMSAVDDFGRYFAKPELLIAALYPLRVKRVRESDVRAWLSEVSAAGLAIVYAVGGKEFLELVDFRQQVRAKESKFPQPPADAQHTQSTCIADATQLHTKTLTKSKTEAGPLRALPEDWQPSVETTENLAREFGLAPEDIVRYVGAFRDACAAKGYRYKDFDAAFRNCVRKDWPKFRERPGILTRTGNRLPI